MEHPFITYLLIGAAISGIVTIIRGRAKRDEEDD